MEYFSPEDFKDYLTALRRLYSLERKSFRSADQVVALCEKYLRQPPTGVELHTAHSLVRFPMLNDRGPVGYGCSEGFGERPKHAWMFDAKTQDFIKMEVFDAFLDVLSWPFTRYLALKHPDGSGWKVINLANPDPQFSLKPDLAAMRRKLLELDIRAQTARVEKLREMAARLNAAEDVLEFLEEQREVDFSTTPYTPIHEE